VALFKRGDDDSGWTVDRMSDGTPFRWRVRMERIGDILPQYREALEAVAREEGYTLEEYVEWAANLTEARMKDTRDRIMSGLAGRREATLYSCWLEARAAVHEVQYRMEVRPGKFVWSGR
jgi:hypothetical protein